MFSNYCGGGRFRGVETRMRRRDATSFEHQNSYARLKGIGCGFFIYLFGYTEKQLLSSPKRKLFLTYTH